MKKVWKIKEKNIANNQSIIDRLLALRGISSEKRKEDFLNPLKMNFTSPYVFNDMKKCVERIEKAVENQEKVVVWGDFDADGITSTCLLYKTLKAIGADAEYYIPSRQEESHGLNSKGIVKFLNKKTKLFITVDCGSTNHKEASFIKSFGADLIITDHHETEENLPDCFGIINPKAQNNLNENLCVEEIDSLTNLAGVGVAFKLALALIEKYGKKELKEELLVLVTVGTIADIVPLLGENRAFVKLGLELIKKEINKGLSVLLKSINYNYEITSDCIAFYVAPRINASGRLATAQTAFNLLYETDEEKLFEYAKELNEANTQRQEKCDETYNEAIELINQDKDFEDNPAIVLYKPDWHIGVIGIVASRLVESFYKPVFLMCDKGELVSCSSRGIEETDIHEIIIQISDLIENGGGHKMAGGFGFDKNKTSFESIKSEINKIVKTMTEGIELVPHINIDLELEADEINLNLVQELQKLEPYGTANPYPLFCCKNLEIISSKLMGQNNNHLKLQCKKENSEIIDCVFWNKDTVPKAKNNITDAAFYLKINEYNGEKNVQLDLKDLNYDEQDNIKFIDQRNKENIFEILDEYCKNNNENISIYAYKNDTLDKISKYENLSKNILLKAQKVNQLVFADYPKSKEKMKIILDKTQPEIVHITQNTINTFSVTDYIKTFSGLLKYVLNKKNGNINISDLSNYFTYDEKIIKESLTLLQKANMLEISDGKITNFNSVELSKLKSIDEYELISKDLEENNNFLNKLANENVEDFIKMFS